MAAGDDRRWTVVPTLVFRRGKFEIFGEFAEFASLWSFAIAAPLLLPVLPDTGGGGGCFISPAYLAEV